MYATIEHLQTRYGADTILQLAHTNERTLDIDKVNDALMDATQTIDSYLGGRYAVPITPVPLVLVRHTCYLARYFLEKNRATDQARRDYEDSLRFLEQVATGKVALVLDSGENQADKSALAPNDVMMVSAQSVFNRRR